MNTIFHLKKALFYSTILLSLIILLEGCKKKSTVEDFGTRIDQCYEDRIDTTLMADGTMFIETTGTAPLNSAVDVIDKHGKLLAQGACCSERTIFNFIRYLYDDQWADKRTYTFFWRYRKRLWRKARNRIIPETSI